jgi:hypothetical protein
MEDRSRLAMARTGMRAFEHCDELSDSDLHDRDTAIALQNHDKNIALAHNWGAQNVAVAVQVNVPMPTAEERAEMREMDRKLDAIAAKLKA